MNEALPEVHDALKHGTILSVKFESVKYGVTVDPEEVGTVHTTFHGTFGMQSF